MIAEFYMRSRRARRVSQVPVERVSSPARSIRCEKKGKARAERAPLASDRLSLLAHWKAPRAPLGWPFQGFSHVSSSQTFGSTFFTHSRVVCCPRSDSIYFDLRQRALDDVDSRPRKVSFGSCRARRLDIHNTQSVTGHSMNQTHTRSLPLRRIFRLSSAFERPKSCRM